MLGSVFAQYNAINSATINIGRVLTQSEALELRYTVTDSELLQFSYQTVGLEVNLQCRDTLVIRDETHVVDHHNIVRLQQGTHFLYWYVQQFDCDIQFMHIRPVYLDNNSTEIAQSNTYVTVPSNIFDITSLSLRGQIHTMTDDVKPASLYDMMHWRAINPNDDYTVFRWQQYPNVLVFFFKDKQVQARYLKRLAFFVEKRGTRGSIMYDEQIAHRKGWGAHNYTIEDIRIFFEKGRTQKFPRIDATTGIFPFHTEELDLKYLLIRQGFLLVSEKDKALLHATAETGEIDYNMIANMPILSAKHYMVSIALTYSEELITALLCHELLHTFYFHDEQLRDYVATVWQQLNTKEQSIWKRFFAYNGYDETHAYLVQNEFFAYLLQRPIQSLSWYLTARIIPESKVSLNESETAHFSTAMQEIAKTLEQYIHTVYGVNAGNVMYVEGE